MARSARRLGAAHRRDSERRPDLHAQPVPRRPPTASRGAVGCRRNGALDPVRRRGPRFRTRSAVCVRRQLRPDSGRTSGRRRRPNRQRRARWRFAAAGHLGLAAPGRAISTASIQANERKDDEVQRKGDEVRSYGRDPRRCEPAGSLCGLDLPCRHELVAVGHDQRRIVDSGQHQGRRPPSSTLRSRNSRRRTRESRSSRSSTSGRGRRSPRSSPRARCRRSSRCRSRTPARSARTVSSPI